MYNNTQAYSQNETINKNKQFIMIVLHEIFKTTEVTEEICANYFSPRYQQEVNNEILNYRQFVDHIKCLKATLKTISITFEEIICENNKVCTVHYATAIKNNGQVVKFKVIALFEIEQDKIISCKELTHLLVGASEDHDLGSRS